MIRVLSLLVVLSIVAAVTAVEDSVVLKNGRRMPGVIVPDSQDDVEHVTIKTATGYLRLRRDLIATAEPSFETRKAQLQGDDYAGYLTLAKWCLSHKMRDQAYDLLTHAVTLAGATAEGQGLFARLNDEVLPPEKGLGERLPPYRRYQEMDGKDPVLLARLALLDRLEREYQRQLSNPTAVETPEATAVVPANEGMETRTWIEEAPQWSNPIKLELLSNRTGNVLNRYLQVTFTGGDKHKAAFKKTVGGIPASDNPVLSLWVINPNPDPVRLSLAVKTGANYAYFESPYVDIKPDAGGKKWQEIHFSLKDKTFRTWNNSGEKVGAVDNIDDVKELQFLIGNDDKDGKLLIDAIAFLTPQQL